MSCPWTQALTLGSTIRDLEMALAVCPNTAVSVHIYRYLWFRGLSFCPSSGPVSHPESLLMYEEQELMRGERPISETFAPRISKGFTP